MINRFLQIETRGFVFLGNFNPSIFHPSWLASKNLIQEEEAQNAKIDVVMNELSRFQLGDWLDVEVSRNRCEFKTMKSPYFLPMKDLASDVFKILGETPIKAVGINNVYDLSLKNKDDYYKFGNTLAPLSNWDDMLNSPRLLNIEIIENNEEAKPLLKRINISPSETRLKVNFGININVNNHFILPANSTGNRAAILLEENNEFCAENSKKIVSNILSKVFD
ncbi:hypothetical protein [Bacteroides acidifaciens]|uniref:hypothetical protein n=1 Tax=Bacteroides acidifaciens TaxID=85831 RepID=UPI0023C26842|nr:hypothetical protein [Bacteroides acidifaciens]MDE6822297.1 hypothetical protein [Bacteroides acidifaciens]